MSDTDPFTPPKTNVVETGNFEEWPLGEPRGVPVGNGWSWIADGFVLFTRSPLFWIVNFVIFMVLIILVSLIGTSLAAQILQPIFEGGFMRSCRELDSDGEMSVSDLFAGFSENGGKLALVGLLHIVASIVVLIVVVIILMIGYFSIGEENVSALFASPEQQILMISLIALIVTSLLIPIVMAFWFTSPLVMLHDVDVFESIRMSFFGCLRNVLPFLIYGLVFMVLAVIASIPFFLGWFVLGPVFIATMYTAYKDIFVHYDQAV